MVDKANGFRSMKQEAQLLDDCKSRLRIVHIQIATPPEVRIDRGLDQ